MTDVPPTGELTPPDRTLMGPGPSDVHPRVLRAMATPLVGYLDDAYVEIMTEVQQLLRYLFLTENEHTLAVSGTGSAAMEMALANMLEPEETVLVPSNGYFGQRMGQVAARAGADVVTVEAPWGKPLETDDVRQAFSEHDPTVFGFVHGETSTGVRQPEVDELTAIARDHDAFTVVDTVASLGGVEFRTDDWGVDVAYAGSQKCLSAPPGASPITFNDRAVEKIRKRESPVRTWYLDLLDVWDYWRAHPSYHHTGPISTMYALREALRLVAEEGLEARWERHRAIAGALTAGIEGFGLSIATDDDYWLPTLTAVSVPDAVEPDAIIETMLSEHGIEIVGGLGDLAGQIFRVGCMGHSARSGNVTDFIAAFGDALATQGMNIDYDAGVAATARALP